jgi:hypothetical protein
LNGRLPSFYHERRANKSSASNGSASASSELDEMQAELALLSARVKQQLINVSDDAPVAPMPMQFEADLNVCRPFFSCHSIHVHALSSLIKISFCVP